MVVGDSLPSPIMPPIQPQQRLVEGDNDIEVLHILPPVLTPIPGLPAQPPPPGGREVEGKSSCTGQVFFPAGVGSPALIPFSPATPAASTPAAALDPSPSAPDLQPDHPLGPPDLVDHRPNSSQPELASDLSAGLSSQVGGPPDLTRPRPSPNLVSHDQHYEFYSQAYTHSQQGRTLTLLTVDC